MAIKWQLKVKSRNLHCNINPQREMHYLLPNKPFTFVSILSVWSVFFPGYGLHTSVKCRSFIFLSDLVEIYVYYY